MPYGAMPSTTTVRPSCKLKHLLVRCIALRSRILVISLCAFSFVGYIVLLKSWQRYSATAVGQEIAWRALREQCGSCSLVTNSGDILGSYVGSRIDKSDCIIRINDAPTATFEDDVGTKTTIRVVDGENLDAIFRSFSMGEPTPQYIIVYDPQNRRKQSYFQHRHEFREKSVIMLHRNDKVFDKAQHLLINSNGAGKILSVAFIAFIVSNEICRQELNVFGMAPAWYCDKYKDFEHDAPKNYYPPGDKEKKCPQTRNFHDFMWTSNFDIQEAAAAEKLTKSSDKIHLREYAAKL